MATTPLSATFATSEPQQPQGFDINAFIAAMQQIAAQNQQGRLTAQRERTSGAHYGMGGAPVVADPSPFDTGFFKSSAAQLTPEARLASQGNNAMNQWAQLGQVDGVDPQKLRGLNAQTGFGAPAMPDYSAAAAGASPEPYRVSQSPWSVAAPQADPDMNMVQNQQMAQTPRAFAQPTPRPTPMPQPATPRPQATPFSFGASARPRPNFSFGAR